MKKAWVIIVLVVVAQAIVSPVCRASETNSEKTADVIYGIIWRDENRNSILEPTESAIPHADIYVRGAEQDFSQHMIADGDGIFSVRDLPHGLYEVWGETADGATEPVILEINEVSPITMLSLAFTAPLSTEAAHQFWMPLIVQ